MKIEFSVEGGFAHFPGLARPTLVDTATLPAPEAAALEQLVRAAGFFSRPSVIAGAPGSADHRTYVISVDDGSRKHEIRIDEPIGDPSLQALVDDLRGRRGGPS